VLASDFTDVEALFGFTYSSNNANFRIFSRTNDLSATSFTLTINPGANTFTATVGADTITLTKTALSGGGYRLSAPDSSALAGLSMIYASETTATINVTATQGIADRMYNYLNNALESNTGMLDTQTQSVKDSTTRANDEIARIDRQIELYRESLIKQFGALESLLSSVNTLLTSLQAQQDARNNA
jgi:flagellar hook-associated protein 2